MLNIECMPSEHSDRQTGPHSVQVSFKFCVVYALKRGEHKLALIWKFSEMSGLHTEYITAGEQLIPLF